MKNKLVSVVVPIYNTEKYLKRCVRSITVQSYKKLEIILVDDGSEDKSPEICDELSKKDCRIRVIHKKNGGLSDARNTGLFSAAGDYICFIDSHDFLASDFIETLLYACESYDCDIAQSGIIKTSGSSAEMNKAKARFDIFSGVDMIGELYGENYLTSVVAWNKLYRRKVFHGITYPVGLIREDGATTSKLFYNAENVAVTK